MRSLHIMFSTTMVGAAFSSAAQTIGVHNLEGSALGGGGIAGATVGFDLTHGCIQCCGSQMPPDCSTDSPCPSVPVVFSTSTLSYSHSWAWHPCDTTASCTNNQGQATFTLDVQSIGANAISITWTGTVSANTLFDSNDVPYCGQSAAVLLFTSAQAGSPQLELVVGDVRRRARVEVSMSGFSSGQIAEASGTVSGLQTLLDCAPKSSTSCDSEDLGVSITRSTLGDDDCVPDAMSCSAVGDWYGRMSVSDTFLIVSPALWLATAHTSPSSQDEQSDAGMEIFVEVLPECVADWNFDGSVDAADFFAFLDCYTASPTCEAGSEQNCCDLSGNEDNDADLTGSSDPNDPSYGIPNGERDSSDFYFFLDLFGAGCG